MALTLAGRIAMIDAVFPESGKVWVSGARSVFTIKAVHPRSGMEREYEIRLGTHSPSEYWQDQETSPRFSVDVANQGTRLVNTTGGKVTVTEETDTMVFWTEEYGGTVLYLHPIIILPSEDGVEMGLAPDAFEISL